MQLLIAILVASVAQVGTDYDAKLFNYDATPPVAVREVGTSRHDGIVVHDIRYPSPKGGWVPAYVVVPDGTGPFAAIEFIHWGQGNRSEFLAEALALASNGAISLLIDAPFNRLERDRRSGSSDAPEYDRDDDVQLVVDARRGIDLLFQRPDVDPRRVGYVGHSLGATWGGVLVGVEPRIRTYVLMGGLPTMTDRDWPDPVLHERLSKLPSERVSKTDALLAPINPINFVGLSKGAAKLFQFARSDRFISERAANKYYEAAAEPKTIRWYEGSHEFNDGDSFRDRQAFLRDRLALRPASVPQQAMVGGNDTVSEREIRRALAEWVDAANAGDRRRANRIWANDLIGWYPGQPDDTYGREIEAEQRQPSGRPSTTISLNIDEVIVSGDLAIVRDTWTYSRQPPRPDLPDVIRSFEVWRRQADGAWKIARWISAPETTRR
jgi:ketosteroid isomerase-like protein/dienelactone hydrolase